MYRVSSPSWSASQGVTAWAKREKEIQSVRRPDFQTLRRSKHKITPSSEPKTKAATCISPQLVRASTLGSEMQIKNKRGQLLYDGDFKLEISPLDLREAVFEGMILEGVHLEGANLEEANFRRAGLYWGNFFEANLARTDFEGAQLQGADLKNANLSDANLSYANLGRDNVGGSTQLQGAVLAGARIQHTNFEGAEYSKKTVFPDNFNPTKHNMILRD
jgi:uncharacterized protein YjbI with pentapeptide repeats